jgi:hypothetical protein
MVFVAGSSFSGENKKEYYETTEAEAKTYIEQVKQNTHHDVLKFREAVSTKETAVALAVAVWMSIYGKEKIEKEAPYQAIRVGDCWFVSGSLEKGWLGGTAEAVISAADGRFLNVSHGK